LFEASKPSTINSLAIIHHLTSDVTGCHGSCHGSQVIKPLIPLNCHGVTGQDPGGTLSCLPVLPRPTLLNQDFEGGFLLARAQVGFGLRIVLNMRSIIFWPAILFLITPAGAKAAEKKLIEFGWDEPDMAFMREHAAEMECSPFDGCVFQTP